MNTVQNLVFPWEKDLAASRDLNPRQKHGYAFVLRWYEKWRAARLADPGHEAARAFWRIKVLSKPREPWQREQWAEAFQWYLKWLKLDRPTTQGEKRLTVGERVKRAVDRKGASRGLAVRTRRVYAGWAARFACWAGGDKETMDPERAREWLSWLVTHEKVRSPLKSSETKNPWCLGF